MRPGVIALFLFLAIFGSKLAIIDRFGSDLPYWDQWPAEGRYNFLPWVEHHELWRGLFTPTNEHRIVPTRLLSLGLFLVGGQWDVRVQTVTNAAIHSALAVVFFLWAGRNLRRGWALATAVFLIVVVAPGIPWENVVAGIQSVFYFLVGFSLVAMGLLLDARAFSARWWIGIAGALIAMVTMGSGALCVLPVALVVVVRLWRGRVERKPALISLAVYALIFAVGVWQRPEAPWIASGHAHTAGQFFLYAARCLAWPLPQQPWLAGLFWLPWLVLLLGWAMNSARMRSPATDFIVAAGVWVLLQTAAVSYARGSGTVLPGVRYGDVTGIGVVLGFVSLAVLAGGSRRWLAATIGVGYFALVAACVALVARDVWQHSYPEKKATMDAYERNVRAFLLTDDVVELEKQKDALPHPEWWWLRDFLRRPVVPGWMPGSVRPPLPLADFAVPEPREPAPPLAHRRTRTVAGPPDWKSSPLPMGRGWWKIETAGHLGVAGASLQVVATADGRVLGEVVPSKSPGASWRAAYVRAPREPAVLIARSDSAARWLAFSEPVEIASLSYGTWRLAKQGQWIALAGMAGVLAATGLACWQMRGTAARGAENVPT